MSTHLERTRAIVRGAVQGVEFCSFVHRLARELDLAGWVSSSTQGVFIEVEGGGSALRQFLIRLEREIPPPAIIQSFEFSFLDAVGYKDFAVRADEEKRAKTALIPSDIATCGRCVAEIFQPDNRRFRYPTTNCANCGPRFSIIEGLPCDRPNTSMKNFAMCPDCEREYQDPSDRRFHAQLNACPVCGPHLEMWDADGNVVAPPNDVLHLAAEEIRGGRIVALKGLGGFQILADARNEAVVQRLRGRQGHSEKPFTLMYPSLEMAREHCRISELEERLLLSPEAPIVLLQRWSPPLAPSIAAGSPNLGVMLPSTPLHHLLMRELGFPVVATGGNLSDEPVCIDEREALNRLRGIADFFLVHNLPMVRAVDDSVARIVRGREMILRRARGYAPLPVRLKTPLPCVLAVGGHLKNTVALSIGREVFVSQPIGDLRTSEAQAAFRAAAADLPRLHEAKPEAIACDLHPDSLSTQYAAQLATRLGVPLHPVQHHWAHVLSCQAENEVEFPALGVAWDGAGYGTDGTIWGGEFLLAGEKSFERVAHFRPFRLPGDAAEIAQPRRSALGVLYEFGGAKALEQTDPAPVGDFSAGDLALTRQLLERGRQAQVTSSVGRLIDAVASLVGLRQQATFAGQAAMELEFAIQPCVGEAYSFEIKSTSPSVVDWRPMIEEMVDDVRRGLATGVISAKFHNALVEIIIAVARHVGQTRVILTGGCFQNRYLLERSVQRLLEAGFRPYWHQRVPTNDGGIALGQIVAVARSMSGATEPIRVESQSQKEIFAGVGPI